MTYLIVDPDDLNQGTEVVFDPAGSPKKTIQLLKAGNLGDEGVTLQCLYSFCKEEWKSDAALIKFPFPFIAITEEKFELVNGWDFKDATTRNLVRIGGWALKSDAGVSEEEYSGIVTLGVIGSGDQAYYAQTTATDATPVNIVLTGVVNQAVKVYGDATHGSIDYRGCFKIFVREYAKTYGMSQLSDIGVTTMTYQVYRFPLANGADLKIIATDTVVDGEAPYTGMSIEWFSSAQGRQIGATTYYFHVIIDGNAGTAEQIYTYFQRQLRKATDIDAGAGNKTGKITKGVLNFVGDSLYTLLYTTAQGTYIDDHLEIDRTRLYFADDSWTGTYIQFPYAAVLSLQFGDNLKADSLAKYWAFFTNDDAGTNEGRDYGTSTAILVDSTSAVATVHRARASNIATIGTVSAHGLSIGDGVKVAGVGGTGYNGNAVVASVPDTTHFTYANSGSDESEAADTGGTITRTMVGNIALSVGTAHRARATNVATIGTVMPHGLSVDNAIIITGLPTAYNGSYTVSTVPDTTHFTYANTGGEESETADLNGVVTKAVGASSVTFSFAYDTNLQRGAGSDGEDAPITVVGIGLSTAQFVVATGTILRSLANVVSLVAALERNYKNA